MQAYIILTGLIWLSLYGTKGEGLVTTSCNADQLDVVFMLDSSASQGSDNFRIQKDFVTNFVNQSDIGPSHVQVGLVTFTSTAKNEFYLNTYTNKTSIISAVQALHFRSGTSATDKGLNTVRYNQFVRYHGDRPSASKIVIVMADGRSNEMDKTLQQAYLLKRTTGAKVLTIGVGSSVYQYELQSIASGSNYTFTLTSRDQIPVVTEKVKAVTCKDGQQPTPQTADCGNKVVDIVFVLDSSASEGQDNFQHQVEFIRDFASQVTISPKSVQLSVVVFSSVTQEKFSLGHCQDKACIFAALNQISYNPGRTETGNALNYVRMNSFSSNKGSRGAASKLVVVITDGRSSNPRQTATEATLLKQNADIISIGIGIGVDQTELFNIASSANNTLPIANFDALKAIKTQLVHLTC